MPRIDNTRPEVVVMYALAEEFGQDKIPAVDLCWQCYVADGFKDQGYDVQHPKYEDGEGQKHYRCLVCGSRLGVGDE